MAVEKKFIKKALNYLKVKEFLEKELEKAGVSSIIVQKTPIATRISLHVRRPGIVVGKRGSSIKELSELLQTKFGLDNPQIEVIEVDNPSLDAKLMAEKIGKQIELRGNAKRVMRMALSEIMGAGAVGAEIRVAGKIIGKGGKAKTLKVREGYLKKSGELVKLVRKGKFVAYLKAGAIGVSVEIVPPDTLFPDQVNLEQALLEQKPVAHAASETQERMELS